MDKFLEVAGILIVLVTLGIIGLILSNTSGSPGLVAMGLATWGVPGIIGGIVLAAFGQMLGQLKAIRYATERQLQLQLEANPTKTLF
jgi:hypothetical protein